MIKQFTSRGFPFYEFLDRLGEECSVQKASLATDDCIWIGIDHPKPKILASKLHNELTGWIDYPIPDDVKIYGRMQLTREQVAQLLPILEKFVETGDI